MFTSSACDNQVSSLYYTPNLPIFILISAGTYGGHVELSAFAHMTRRNVKVVQPGLVYVIEWDAGSELSDTPAPSLTSLGLPEVDPSAALVNERDRRKAKREGKRLEKAGVQPSAPEADDEQGSVLPTGPVYVAYVSDRRGLCFCLVYSFICIGTTTGSIFHRFGICAGRMLVYPIFVRCRHQKTRTRCPRRLHLPRSLFRKQRHHAHPAPNPRNLPRLQPLSKRRHQPLRRCLCPHLVLHLRNHYPIRCHLAFRASIDHRNGRSTSHQHLRKGHKAGSVNDREARLANHMWTQWK